MPSGGRSRFHEARFRRQEAGESLYVVAWDGDTPVGHVHLLWESEYDAVRSWFGRQPEINALNVAPALQGRGIGTALVADAERRAAERGAESIGLAVEVANVDARRLYERLGYRDWGGGLVEDVWRALLDDDTEIEHRDPCHYLVKPLGPELQSFRRPP